MKDKALAVLLEIAEDKEQKSLDRIAAASRYLEWTLEQEIRNERKSEV